jgi:hypothetical protein
VTIEQEGGGRWQRLQPRERALIIIVGIIAALAVIYLLFLSGGESEPEAFPSFTPRPTSTAVPTVAPTSVTTSPPETFEVFEGKDPFRPLVPAGGVSPVPAPSGSPGSSGGANGSQHVTLIDISGSGENRTATVEVNSTQYEVKEGDTFAGSYRVKNLTADCGTFVFGDETFTLCTGQEVLK